MRLGIVLPFTRGADAAETTLASDARAAEKAGFDSVWFFDSINRGWMSLEPLMAACVAAAATEHIEVGTGVLQVPLRDPVELAHRVLTAQVHCEGRLVLGVGSGSTKADFDAVGRDFPTRLQALDEDIALMRRLWAGENIDGVDLKPGDAVLGGPPVIIGSWGGKHWIPKAAQEFDGWIASGVFGSLDILTDGIRSYREAGGRRAIVTNIAVDLSANEPLVPSERPFHLRCGPQEAAERLGRLAELGFDDAVLVHRGEGEPDLDQLRALLPR